jgi:hypothetical protein
MQRGPKPQLPATKLDKGTYQPCRDANRVELIAPDALPQRPDWLTAAGEEVWMDTIGSEQPGDFGFDLDQGRLSGSVVPIATSNRERPTARQSAGEPTHRGLRASCARRLSDTVDPAALLFSRGNTEPRLLLQGA